MYILELGKNKELSIAELGSLVDKDANIEIAKDYAIIDKYNKDLDMLGGVVKWFKQIGEFNSMNEIYNAIYEEFKNDEGKIVLGFDWKLKTNKTYSQQVKDYLKEKGLRVSVAGERNSKYTSSGAVIKRKILSKGANLLILEWENKFILAGCFQVQNIPLFEMKDYKKPVRDMERGMMPPKLARTILNIGLGTFFSLDPVRNFDANRPIIWDPFCGLGSTLMECIDWGFESVGTDVDPKAISGCKKNIDWYKEKMGNKTNSHIFAHDAQKPLEFKLETNEINMVIGEGYLGKVTTQGKINADFIQSEKQNAESLYLKFFEQLAKMDNLKVICFGLPFWIMNNKDYFLDDRIFEPLKRAGFENMNRSHLTYTRKDSVVGRDIMVWSKR